MEPQLFSKWNTPIQVGGLDTTNAQTVAADTSTTAFSTTVAKIVEVRDVDGTGAWFLIGATGDTLAPAADSGVFIPPYGTTRPFILPADGVIEATAKIQVNTLDIEDV